MTQRLLLVEQSTTMRYVLEKHAQTLGYVVDASESYERAAELLSEQYRQYGKEYSVVLFGWPTTAQDDADEFANTLSSSNHKDLPVVTMSTDLRAQTRAWVAEREKTAILAWKDYLGLEAVLAKIIDPLPAETIQPVDLVSSNNSDIHLLVVDDSATIRLSLRDLFQAKGYRVTLAATREEAMQYATQDKFDIAVLDYYLTQSTGDMLCRELLASEHTGDIVCTVLTGTYSDHIIKRSLRAGAVECMFKNESSELLLSRIDAISRFVRQKRQLHDERALLEDVLESIAGALILLDKYQRITYVNELALQELGGVDRSALIGQSATQLLEQGGPQIAGDDVHEAIWTPGGLGNVTVDYQHTLITSRGHALLRFTQRMVAIDHDVSVGVKEVTRVDMAAEVSDTMARLSMPEDARTFLIEMQGYVYPTESSASVSATVGMHCSLLVLDVFQIGEHDDLMLLDSSSALSERVGNTLTSMLTRKNHVRALGPSRFGFLFRHAEDPHAYIMARKVMQRCLSVDQTLACKGSLLGLDKHSGHSMTELLRHAYTGMELMEQKDPNQALLMDIRRLLTAHPVLQNSTGE